MTAGEAVTLSRRQLRDILVEAGGVAAEPRSFGTAGPPIANPFGSAEPVEGDRIDAVPIRETRNGSRDALFADGIQQVVIEGWIGITPVVRAHVGAAVLARRGGRLTRACYRAEEMLVVPRARLAHAVLDDLEAVGLPLYDAEPSDRDHPVMDVQRAVGVVERRRETLERDVIDEARTQFPESWIVVDGSIGALAGRGEHLRTVGVIKSHETQFLAGKDLERALTLPAGWRTSVFQRIGPTGGAVHSWYIRMWDWSGQGILFGLARLERIPHHDVSREVDDISAWLFAERAPVAGADRRWDRLLYPIRAVEDFLRAKAGAWW